MTRADHSSDRAARFVAFLDRRKAWVLGATTVLMLAGAAGVRQLEIESSFAPFMPSDSVHLRALQDMVDSFGDGEPLLVLVALGAADADAAALSDTEAAFLDDLVERLDAVAGVGAVLAPPTVSRTATTSAPSLPGAPAVVRDDAGERHALLRLLPAEDADPQVLVAGVRDALEAAGAIATVTGEPRLAAEAFGYVRDIVTRLPPLALLLILLVFRWRIGSARATLLSLVPAVVAAALTMGGLGWTIGSVSLVTALVPIFVIVLGSADGLHLTSHVLDRLRSGDPRLGAVTETLRAVGAPIAITTATTMAGFLALTVIDSPAIRQLGIAAASGVFIAGAASFFVLPTLLLAVPLRAAVRGERRDPITAAVSRLRGTPALLLAGGLLLAFAPGVLRVGAEFSMVDVYKATTDVRRDLDRATAILGGALPMYLTYPGADTLDGATAAAVLEVQDRALDEGLADRSLSLPSLLRDVWHAQTGERAYPPHPLAARAIVAAASAAQTGALGQFVAPDGTGRALLFLRDLGDDTLTQLADLTHEVAERTGIALEAVGVAYVMQAMNQRIVPQQLASLALALALVFLLTLLGQRSLRLAAVTVVPIALTLVVLFGTMGYLGIDLSVVTGIMTGLTIGVGIDYAIHFSSTLRREQARGTHRPVDAAVDFVATPVLANALGLAIGFSVMALSPLQIHLTLAILMWVTMLVSALLSLTLLPTIAARRPTPIVDTGVTATG